MTMQSAIKALNVLSHANKSLKSNQSSILPRILMASGALTMAVLVTGCNQTQGAKDDKAASETNATADKNQDISLLNVSYDVSRDFYKEYNPLFTSAYKAQFPDSTVDIKQSHGGASKQALSVANGLQADVVTLNQESDMNMLVEKGLVKADWRQAFPDNAVPYTTTMILLVRKGNPKQIKDWQDLARSDVEVVMPNPKTSGTARYAF